MVTMACTIDLLISLLGESSITSEAFTVSGGQEFNSAPVSSSESILANSTVRNKFLDSLFEVNPLSLYQFYQFYYIQRKFELILFGFSWIRFWAKDWPSWKLKRSLILHPSLLSTTAMKVKSYSNTTVAKQCRNYWVTCNPSCKSLTARNSNSSSKFHILRGT